MFRSQLGHITFVDIDLEIISVVILILSLIQEEQLSFIGKLLVNLIED